MSEKQSTGRPRLLERVRTAIRLRHYSCRTEEQYVQWVRRFIRFHDKRHPADMGGAEVTAFLTHLATRSQVAASTQNQALATHLLEAGYDIHTLRELLGHSSVKTTQIYTHVLNRGALGVRSPMDLT